MLGSNLATSEASVLAKVATLGRPVFDTEEPETVSLTYDKFGVFQPYHVLLFGGPIRSERDRSLCGAAQDPVIVALTAYSFAPNTTQLRTIHGELVDALTGFYPTASGEMTLQGGMNFSIASNTVRPTLYGRTTFFEFLTNLSTSN